MSENTTNANRTSRRQFLTDGGRIAGVSTLAGMTIPYVHAAENALGVKNGAIRLVAMADVFPSKPADSHGKLRKEFPAQVDVPEDRKFIGFDGYRQARDWQKPGDVAIFATPPAFRWVHFSYAIDK